MTAAGLEGKDCIFANRVYTICSFSFLLGEGKSIGRSDDKKGMPNDCSSVQGGNWLIKTSRAISDDLYQVSIQLVAGNARR